LNIEIQGLEDKNTLEYRKTIEENLAYQLKKITDHHKNKPKIVEKPDKLTESKYAGLSSKISQEISTIENSIQIKEVELAEINKKLSKIEDIIYQKDNILKNVEHF